MILCLINFILFIHNFFYLEIFFVFYFFFRYCLLPLSVQKIHPSGIELFMLLFSVAKGVEEAGIGNFLLVDFEVRCKFCGNNGCIKNHNFGSFYFYYLGNGPITSARFNLQDNLFNLCYF